MITNFIKRSALTGALLFIGSALFAQAPFTGTSQFRKFSIGVNAGALRPSIITGGGNDFTKPLYSFGYGANLKYQFTHQFGIQADFLKGKLKGNNDKNYSTGAPATDRPIASFETDLNYAVSLSGVLTFGSINWLSNTTRVVPYITGGAGTIAYKPVTIATGSTTEVPFDNGDAQNEFFVPVGIGLKFMLSDLVNLDLGYRANFVDNDNFDGTTQVQGNIHKDKFSYGFLGLEFALGAKQKKQLMFDNPAAKLNDILQTQITKVQTDVDSIKAQLSTVDSDNDGVFDQFDKEPNTPAGAPVDFRGVSRDTDGDGVPDYKDKQLITPTECQPVDADGVGKCPDPECCKNMVAAGACNLGDLPSITFRGNSNSLSRDAKAMLATVASKLKGSADCSITVTGYPAASKASQALCNRRANAVKAYLTETEGISADRIITNCEVGGGDANVIDIKSNL
jgi:outer membrane protein OmpA-like peptidoglycan-associated protein/opacity protein-like surface antigen